MQPWKTTNSSLRERNHGIFSCAQLIIGNPCGDGLIELQVEMGLQLLIHPLLLNIKHHFYSPLEFIFSLILSLMVFLFFRSVFSSLLGGMCILGPWSDNDGLLAGFFVLQHNATLTDRAKRMAVGESLVERESSRLRNLKNSCCLLKGIFERIPLLLMC